MKLEYAKDNLTQQPYRHYLKRYQDTSPRVISESSGLTFHEKEQAFLIRFMGALYQVTHLPAGEELRDPASGVSQDHGKPAWGQKGDGRCSV